MPTWRRGPRARTASSTPRPAKIESAAGGTNSPQILCRGNRAASHTATERPPSRRSVVSVDPAGPPPATTTSKAEESLTQGPRARPGPSSSIRSRCSCTGPRSEEHTSELQSPCNLVCRLLLEKKKNKHYYSDEHRVTVPSLL